MEIEERQHRGYVLEGKEWAGQWQVHIYPASDIQQLPPALPAIQDRDKERAFAKAEQRVSDFLDRWARRTGGNDSPTLRARRS